MLDAIAGFSFEHFHFLRPWWALMTIPFAGVWWFQYQQKNTFQRWKKLISPHLLGALTLKGSDKQWFSPLSLLAMALVIFILILMGPSWRKQPSPFEQDRAAFFIALDVSQSMTSGDIQPNRLERAKQKIADLLALRAAHRNALLVYAGSAHSVLPLTDDINILEHYLRAINPDIMPRPGKKPETIIPLIEHAIGDENLPVTVLLIGDGIGSETKQAFQRFFSTPKRQLLVLGVGGSSEDIQQQGLSNIPALDLSGLTSLASISNGHLIKMTVDGGDIQQIYRRIDAHMVSAEDQAIPWLDAGYFGIFAGMLIVLPWFRKGWSLHWSWLASIMFIGALSATPKAQAGVFSDLWLSQNQQGRWHFQQGRYLQAAEHFQDLHWKATAYYRAEEFLLAAEYYSRINGPQARFNQANALAHSDNYLPAVALYDELLRQYPNYPGAVENRKIVQDIIDAINLLSESQLEERNESKRVQELDDSPQRADGAERKTFIPQESIQLSAEDILQDPALNEQWMRTVEPNPANFLSIKFYLQLEQQTLEHNKSAAEPTSISRGTTEEHQP